MGAPLYRSFHVFRICGPSLSGKAKVLERAMLAARHVQCVRRGVSIGRPALLFPYRSFNLARPITACADSICVLGVEDAPCSHRLFSPGMHAALYNLRTPALGSTKQK